MKLRLFLPRMGTELAIALFRPVRPCGDGNFLIFLQDGRCCQSLTLAMSFKRQGFVYYPFCFLPSSASPHNFLTYSTSHLHHRSQLLSTQTNTIQKSEQHHRQPLKNQQRIMSRWGAFGLVFGLCMGGFLLGSLVVYIYRRRESLRNQLYAQFAGFARF